MLKFQDRVSVIINVKVLKLEFETLVLMIQSYSRKGRVCISKLEFQNYSAKVSKSLSKKSFLHFKVKVSI